MSASFVSGCYDGNAGGEVAHYPAQFLWIDGHVIRATELSIISRTKDNLSMSIVFQKTASSLDGRWLEMIHVNVLKGGNDHGDPRSKAR